MSIQSNEIAVTLYTPKTHTDLHTLLIEDTSTHQSTSEPQHPKNIQGAVP